MPILNVAKYNLGSVRLELMQSADSPLTVHDPRGGPLGICRAFVSRYFSHALLLADLCGSIALVSESLRILTDRSGSFSICFSKSLRIHADLPRSICRASAISVAALVANPCGFYFNESLRTHADLSRSICGCASVIAIACCLCARSCFDFCSCLPYCSLWITTLDGSLLWSPFCNLLALLSFVDHCFGRLFCQIRVLVFALRCRPA